MKPDLTKAKEHPCTFPLHEQHTKSICHQTFRVLLRVIRKSATRRFSSDPHCIISGKSEAQVLSGGGRLWPGEGGKVSVNSLHEGPQTQEKVCLPIVTKRRRILPNAFGSGLCYVTSLKGKSAD